MAIISTDSQYYTDIATAIRAKLGNGERLKPREMASAIGNIESSLIEKSITSNGTYEAVDDNADGYSSVSVNVVAPPPVLQTLSVSSNGSYTPPTGVDGFDEVTVTVTPSLQSKTVNQNGIITPDSGYDGLSQVVVNVQGGGSLIADWDFKTGLTDSVHGLAAVLGGNASQGSDGITIPDASSYIDLPVAVKGVMRTYEIDVGAMTLQGTGHHRFFVAGGSGFIYRSTGVWAFYSNSRSWQDTDITDFAFFANSTVKIFIDENLLWHIYKNGTLVFEPSTDLSPLATEPFRIGQSNNSVNQSVIEGCRVY